MTGDFVTDGFCFVCHVCGWETRDAYTVEVLNDLGDVCPGCGAVIEGQDFVPSAAPCAAGSHVAGSPNASDECAVCHHLFCPDCGHTVGYDSASGQYWHIDGHVCFLHGGERP